jgi:hypothetical protein
MMLQRNLLLFALAILSFLAAPAHAAGCGHHLGVGAGVVHLQRPSETDFDLGVEYECRMNPFVGLGGFGNYIFSSPGILMLGAPEFYLHPLAGDFYINASPILETGSAVGTHVGARIGTRIPIPLALFVLEPSLAVDFIAGGRIYWFGLGVRI